MQTGRLQPSRFLSVKFLVLLLNQLVFVVGHGRFLEPPSRASMWRMGFLTEVDYQDHEGNCGGMFHQWKANGGRCGVCGDKWDEWPRPHEQGGRFATGHIVRRYSQAQVISSVIEVTTAHEGYMEFRICKLSPEQQEATQPCLDKMVLELADGSGTRYPVGNRSEMARIKLHLPSRLTCQHCVIQWRYRTGNNWGICSDGESRMGCGPQEEFRGCADVSISSDFEDSVNPLHNDLVESLGPQTRGDTLIGDNSVWTTETSQRNSQLGETFEKGLAELFSPASGDNNIPESTQIVSDNSENLLDIRAENNKFDRVVPIPDNEVSPQFGDSLETIGTLEDSALIEYDTTAEDFSVGGQEPNTEAHEVAHMDLAGVINRLRQSANEESNMIEDSSDHHTLRRHHNKDASTRETLYRLRSSPTVKSSNIAQQGEDETTCAAVGIWVTVPGMDSWCINNCGDGEGRGVTGCPPGMCRCVTRSTQTLRSLLAVIANDARTSTTTTTRTTPTTRTTTTTSSVTSSQIDELPQQGEFKVMPRPSLQVIQRSGRQNEDIITPSATKGTTNSEVNISTGSSGERANIRSLLTELAELRQQKKRLRKLSKLIRTRNKHKQAPAKKKKISLKFKKKLRSLKSLPTQKNSLPKSGGLAGLLEAATSLRTTSSDPPRTKILKIRPSGGNSAKSRHHRLLQLKKLRSLKNKSIRLKLPRKSRTSSSAKTTAQWRTHIRCTGAKPWSLVGGVNRWCHERCSSADGAQRRCPVTVCLCSRAHVVLSHPQVQATNASLLRLLTPPAPGPTNQSSWQVRSQAPGFLLLLQPLDTSAFTSNDIAQAKREEQRRKLSSRVERQLRRRRERMVIPLTPQPPIVHHQHNSRASQDDTSGTSSNQTLDTTDEVTSRGSADDNIGCRGVGRWRHSFAMDYWCEVNCRSERMSNCPSTLCLCRGYARLNTA